MPQNMLQKGWGMANEPLLPQSAIQPTVDSLTEPHLDQSPWMARLKGFGAGALEGLRGQTSPLNIAGLATMGMGGGQAGNAVRGAKALPEAIQGLSSITPDLVEAGQGVRQVLPTMGDTEALIGGMRHSLAKIPNSIRQGVQGALPEVNLPAEMIGQGGEGAYNAARAVPPQAMNPMHDAAVAKNLTKPAGSPFQKLQDAGAFSGSRVNSGYAEAPGGLTDALKMLKERGMR